MSVEGAAVSLASTVISIAFAALVYFQWRARHRPYQLAWAAGLAMFAAAAFTQFVAEAYGWSDPVYRVYYFLAAPLVAVLGVGSALLMNRRLGLGFALYTIVVGLGFAYVVLTASVNESALSAAIPGGEGFPTSVRVWSPLFTVPGSIALIGIALYSFWRTRLRFNLWIAAGGVAAAASGGLSTFGLTWVLYLGELLGIALLFGGFLESVDLARAARPVAGGQPQG